MADDEADHGLVVISARLIAVIVVLVLFLLVFLLADPAARPGHHLSDWQLEFAWPVNGGAHAPEQVLTSQAEVARHPLGTYRHRAREGREYEYQARHRLQHKIGHGRLFPPAVPAARNWSIRMPRWGEATGRSAGPFAGDETISPPGSERKESP